MPGQVVVQNNAKQSSFFDFFKQVVIQVESCVELKIPSKVEYHVITFLTVHFHLLLASPFADLSKIVLCSKIFAVNEVIADTNV